MSIVWQFPSFVATVSSFLFLTTQLRLCYDAGSHLLAICLVMVSAFVASFQKYLMVLHVPLLPIPVTFNFGISSHTLLGFLIITFIRIKIHSYGANISPNGRCRNKCAFSGNYFLSKSASSMCEQRITFPWRVLTSSRTSPSNFVYKRDRIFFRK